MAAKRGRKPRDATIKYRDAPLGPEVEEGPETVTVHSIYTIPEHIGGYDAYTSFINAESKGAKRLRVADSAGVWADSTKADEIIYNALIRGRIERLLQPYVASGLYGSVLGDDKFRIHDLRGGAAARGRDGRENPRGRECFGDITAAKATEYLRVLGQPPAPPGQNQKAELCVALQGAFERAGLLFRVYPE